MGCKKGLGIVGCDSLGIVVCDGLGIAGYDGLGIRGCDGLGIMGCDGLGNRGMWRLGNRGMWWLGNRVIWRLGYRGMWWLDDLKARAMDQISIIWCFKDATDLWSVVSYVRLCTRSGENKKHLNKLHFDEVVTFAHRDEYLVDALLLYIEENGAAHAHQQVSILLQQGCLIRLQITTICQYYLYLWLSVGLPVFINYLNIMILFIIFVTRT